MLHLPQAQFDENNGQGCSPHLPRHVQLVPFDILPVRLHHVLRPRACSSGIFLVSQQLSWLVIWFQGPNTSVTLLSPGSTDQISLSQGIATSVIFGSTLKCLEDALLIQYKQGRLSHNRARPVNCRLAYVVRMTPNRAFACPRTVLEGRDLQLDGSSNWQNGILPS